MNTILRTLHLQGFSAFATYRAMNFPFYILPHVVMSLMEVEVALRRIKVQKKLKRCCTLFEGVVEAFV